MMITATYLKRSAGSSGQICSGSKNSRRGLSAEAGQSRCGQRWEEAFGSAITSGVSKRGTTWLATISGGTECNSAAKELRRERKRDREAERERQTK